MEKYIRMHTGLLPHPYFSATKLKWILDTYDPNRNLARSGNLLFGTVDSWLLWNLTGNHFTDYTNASRTMMFDINTLKWDEYILNYLNIPCCMLPEPKPSMCNFGSTTLGSFRQSLVPIMCMAGDQQAALFGHSCFDREETKLTLGTGGFVLMNTKNCRVNSKHQLLTTLACDLNSDTGPCFALEGSILSVGSALTWAREQGWPATCDSELAPDSGGISVVLGMTGLGAPHWESKARGCIFGLSRASNKEQLARAVVEAVCYQCREVLTCMAEDIQEIAGQSNYGDNSPQPVLSTADSIPDCNDGIRQVTTSTSFAIQSDHGEVESELRNGETSALHTVLKKLRIDGGTAANGALVQILANVLGCSLIKQETLEVSALGVAMMAACQVSLISKSYLAQRQGAGNVVMPIKQEVEMEHLNYERWKTSLTCALKWSRMQ